MICNFYSVPHRGTQPPLCRPINNTWTKLIAKQQKAAIWPRDDHSSPRLSSSSSSPSLGWGGGGQRRKRRRPGLSAALGLLSENDDASFIREVSSHRRCGLAMISRDYGWLMVGKYIRNHRLGEGWGGGESVGGGGGDFTHASGFALIHSKWMRISSIKLSANR